MSVDAASAPRGPGTAPRPARRASAFRHVVLAVATFVPMLLTAPGRVAADTKTYLALDPGRLLSRAWSMWDPNTGFGTVTHQNIGYLFPMGPWFWAFDRIGAPDWVAQRLWVATFLFAAGAGVLFLLRTLGWTREDELLGAGALAAAAVYVLTPYVVEFASRLSVLLLPWAGLPWLVALTHRALRTGSWRHPAVFAIVVTVVGSVNATALLLAGIGPLLWVPFAVWVQRDVTGRRALAGVARIGLLTSLCSVWWAAGLAVQGAYGLDVLRYSETVPTVAATSSATEVLRGLGYWFFYGGDKVGPWTPQSVEYQSSLWLLTAGLAMPVVAVAAACVIRWRHRAFAVVLLLTGTVVAVGAHPYESPSPLGAVFRRYASTSTAGLAMRSTPRAVPLLLLAVALLVAAGVAAAGRVRPRAGALASVVVIVVAAVGMAPLWKGDLLGDNLLRDEHLPAYWVDAAEHLDARGDDTRILELPGIDFAAYRWGQTVDPITPGLVDRPYAARELIPAGSAASADLLGALDRRLQEGVLDPAVLAPIARLLGVGDVVLRSDLEHERYRTPRPRQTWARLQPTPAGLDPPVAFGPAVPNRLIARLPMDDETELLTPPTALDPPPVADFGVRDPRPIVRAEPATRPLLLAGDGEGVVQAAAAGMLDGDAPLVYSAAVARRPKVRDQLLDDGAQLVLTDTNRRRGRRWKGLSENTGYTEPAGSRPLREDVSDNRLPLFPDATDDASTVVEQRGVAEVTATSYGNPVTFTPENRAANALDGDLDTAWKAGDFSPVVGERLVIRLADPVTTDRLEVVQPLVGPRGRFITRLSVRVDGEDAGSFALDDRSRQPAGQALAIGRRTFSEIELRVEADNVGARRVYFGMSPVGLAEVRVGDAAVDEVVRLPRDLLAGLAPRAGEHDLTVLLERLRWDPVAVGRTDEEEAIVRAFTLPGARRFTVAGDARLSAYAPAPVVDQLAGIADAAHGGITASGSASLRGDLRSRPSAAVDGDRATAWRTPFGEEHQVGATLDLQLPAAINIDHLDLQLVADGHHSVPTRIRLEGEDGQTRVVDVPLVDDATTRGAVVPATVRFDALAAQKLRVVVEAVRPATSLDYYSERPIVRPIGIAELGIPGQAAASAVGLDTSCRDDLLSIDGRPIGVRFSGTPTAALDRSALPIGLCGADAVELAAGDHTLQAAKGKASGIDLDRLVLTSKVGADDAAGDVAAPRLEVVHPGRVSIDVRVRGAAAPFWLVLGQSHNAGWRATVGGRSLGLPVLVDGFANGWYVDPAGRDVAVSLDWTPQRGVDAALAVSGAALLVCAALVAWERRARRRPWRSSAGWGAGGGRQEGWGAGGGRQSDDDGPVLVSPMERNAPRASLRRVIAGSLAAGLGAGLVVSPLAGLVVAVIVAASLALPRAVGRGVLTGSALAALAAAAGLVLARSVWHGGVPPGFEWPASFPLAQPLALTGLVLVAVDAVLERAPSRPPPGEP